MHAQTTPITNPVVRVVIIKPITVKRCHHMHILSLMTQHRLSIHALENYRLCATTADAISASEEESLSLQGDACTLVVKAPSQVVFENTIRLVKRRYAGSNWLGKIASPYDDVVKYATDDRETNFYYSAIFSDVRGWPVDIKGVL